MLVLNIKILAVTLAVFAAFCTAARNIVRDRYEETVSYSHDPECRPSNLDTGVKCSAIGPSVEIKGGFDTDCGMYYMSLASAYHVARLADAMGYQDNCPANKTFLKKLNIMAAWSGKDNFISIDLACNFERQAVRKCAAPTSSQFYLCSGVDGPPGTYGKRLGTASYNSVLQASNNRWVLFINCWRTKNPADPHAFEIATSFNVFNLDRELSTADTALIIGELKRRGFDVRPSNIIKFDFNNTSCH